MSESKQNELILQELIRRANLHTQRLRNVDEQMRHINSKINNIEQQKIEDQKIINEKLEKIMDNLDEVFKSIDSLRGEILKINEKNKNFAKKREIEELSELLELLSPVKHEFVTWSEFNRELRKLKNEIAIPT
jgi:DNA repair exonuclease SbcCD ATPase subunit